MRTSFDWFESAFDVNAMVCLAGVLILGAWLAVIAALGGYREQLFGVGVDEYKVVLNASLLTAALTGVACYVVRFELSRGFYFAVFASGSVALIAQRALLRQALHKARRAGRFNCDVVIAGTPAHVDGIASVLSRESWLGYRVLGAIVPPVFSGEETSRGTPILGTTDRLVEILDSVGAQAVFVAGGALDDAEQMRELVWELERRDVRVVVAPSVTDVARERVHVHPMGGLPLVHIDPPRHVKATQTAKRLFDVLTATTLIMLSAPLLAAVAVAIKLHDGGPVLFRQVRVGRDGRSFECFKFRTMIIDAETRLALLHELSGYSGEGLFKMPSDPRVTRPGRWLRRFSLDELPQLLNVLRGTMSLVGPRPPLPSEVAVYDRFTRRRLHVRPGMTGLWQVSGRSDLSWAEAVRLDLYYVDNWSMLQDLNILWKTFGAVFRARGAY